jgi:nucleotide-binding universal stress UspA family protein
MSKKNTPRPASSKPSPSSPPRIRRLLVPLDFSGKSRQALRYAVPVAEKFGARIVLLHVVEPVPVTAPEMAMVQPDLLPLKRQAVRQLEELAAALVPPELHDRGVVTIGHAAVEILATAKRVRADMIVLTTHGHSGLKRFFMGSTAEQVVRHATCPVLSVRRQ